jgi:hypothetical protein
MRALSPTLRAALALAAIALCPLQTLPARGAEAPEPAVRVPEASEQGEPVVRVPEAFPSAPLRMEQTGRTGCSPGEALGIGLFATAAPTLIAIGSTTSPEQRYTSRPLAIFLASTAGIVVGPSIGLACGGRSDLAWRGVGIRAGGLALGSLALVGAIASAFDSSSGGDALGLGVLGVACGAVVTLSAVHDLAITPSAVSHGPGPRAALGVRPDGKLAVCVTF